MTDSIVIKQAAFQPAHKQPVEIVERKGKGHPATICDSISERVSIDLSRAYSKATGRILHHNVDKGFSERSVPSSKRRSRTWGSFAKRWQEEPTRCTDRGGGGLS